MATPKTIGGLSLPQAQQLAHKHLTGDFGKHKWETIKILFEKKYIIETNGHIVITESGMKWINQNIFNVPWLKSQGDIIITAAQQQSYNMAESSVYITVESNSAPFKD